MLSLGVTEPAPNFPGVAVTMDANYAANNFDSRSIFKLQRFAIPGPDIPDTTGAPAGSSYLSYVNSNNYVNKGTISAQTGLLRCATTPPTVANTVDGGTIAAATSYFPNGFTGDNQVAMKTLWLAGVSDVATAANRKYHCIVPFPINMFDTREGLYNDTWAVFNPGPSGSYGGNVSWAGVMSMVDIDVANLKKFLDGTWDANMPVGTPAAVALTHVLRSTDIPQNNGWVLYVSDRRGDFDFDGEYDMEDVYGNNDGILQSGEDLQTRLGQVGYGTLQADYINEAPRYTGVGSNVSPEIAAVFDHKYYRRGVRLINGSRPPGIYDSATPANTRGFSASSETGMYVKGDYNAVTIGAAPVLSSDYMPQGANDIPSSIASDAVTILSNNWTDANSFANPFNLVNRLSTETTQRFAMLSGDTITTLNGTPNQGGGDLKMNGGVHNFMRFLEAWDVRFNYSGSLINLFNSHNNNAPFKCCDHVYDPPVRNWIFDATFLDVNRLPPGTPYFQNIQMTGFQRVN